MCVLVSWYPVSIQLALTIPFEEKYTKTSLTSVIKSHKKIIHHFLQTDFTNKYHFNIKQAQIHPIF